MRSPFLHDWLFAHAERRPEAPAVATPSMRVTYGELAGRVRALAGHLAARGVRPGDRVVLALPNLPATVAAGLAVNALGATTVEVNREWSPEILGRILAQTRTRHALVWGRDARTWGGLCRSHPLERLWVVHPGAPPAALLDALGGTPATWVIEDGRVDPAEGAAPPPPSPALSPDQPALVLYTSGSTGQPRGVVQTFRNVDANSRSIVQYLELGESDRALLILPLYYCYGRSVLQTHLLAGGSMFLDGRFAFPRVVLEAMTGEGCTGFAGVPLTFEIIRRQVDVASMRFPTLRYLTQAGGAMAPDTVAWVRNAFQPARLFVMYGQTEATARLAYLPPERGEEKLGSMGVAIPGVELRVVDDGGRELATGETGHLVARGDNVTLGYLDEPEETAAILHDGWLWTGDLASRDADGFFFHRGRSKEILKVGGHRVSPIEIEHAVARHPDVAEAAVVGVQDALMGELPVAFVVPRPGASPTEDDLRRFCREHLPAYQVPVRFTFVDALPRNESGKLLRAELARRTGP
ncbi:AMP-dependent synthetase and ligase [Anaeromyxobacter dehalogenans 2CP-1]|uniref:AMP-dependent synthetase and ligase n=1 Tax=Anaeromyxobacter dehalogenans (strain ATCC BAA-258 / DSM 21875 / 2CP-1) TaxID=455488 RepID=B8JFB8_ANAD2|nr:class I adenylate-forming enzyme family protein [Anaeromyxobacter dehalogenans]ACL66295.1 AMP-dependent synthetase and ligase [Anaeromyxobacter dehalogenans 2CP-1]